MPSKPTNEIVQIVITRYAGGAYKTTLMSRTQTLRVLTDDEKTIKSTINQLIKKLVHV